MFDPEDYIKEDIKFYDEQLKRYPLQFQRDMLINMYKGELIKVKRATHFLLQHRDYKNQRDFTKLMNILTSEI